MIWTRMASTGAARPPARDGSGRLKALAVALGLLALLGRAVTADCQAVRAVLETVRRLQDALH